MTALDVRKVAYNALFAGAMGHTYGCRDVWSFYVPADKMPERDVDTHWKQAINFPGAFHVGYMRLLFSRYPWYNLVPDQDREIVQESYGGKVSYCPALRAKDGSCFLIYIADGQVVTLDLNKLKVAKAQAFWFNPRNGIYLAIDQFRISGKRSFTPPPSDPDWVLVIERA